MMNILQAPRKSNAAAFLELGKRGEKSLEVPPRGSGGIDQKLINYVRNMIYAEQQAIENSCAINRTGRRKWIEVD